MGATAATALPTRSNTKFSPIDLTGHRRAPPTTYETHPEQRAAQQHRNQSQTTVQASKGIRPSLHTPESGFATIGSSTFDAAVPSNASFHPRPATCGASLRSDNETHVSPHYETWVSLSLRRDAPHVAGPGWKDVWTGRLRRRQVISIAAKPF